MRYTREELLRFLETLRDEMMTPMHPLARSKWIAERAYSITGVLVVAREDSAIEESE